MTKQERAKLERKYLKVAAANYRNAVKKSQSGTPEGRLENIRKYQDAKTIAHEEAAFALWGKEFKK